jgi:hypothetical protein
MTRLSAGAPDERAAVAALWRAFAARLRNTLGLAATKAWRSRELIPTGHCAACRRIGTFLEGDRV